MQTGVRKCDRFYRLRFFAAVAAALSIITTSTTTVIATAATPAASVSDFKRCAKNRFESEFYWLLLLFFLGTFRFTYTKRTLSISVISHIS